MAKTIAEECSVVLKTLFRESQFLSLADFYKNPDTDRRPIECQYRCRSGLQVVLCNGLLKRVCVRVDVYFSPLVGGLG